jgi:CheY-like chemotaxis protein
MSETVLCKVLNGDISILFVDDQVEYMMSGWIEDVRSLGADVRVANGPDHALQIAEELRDSIRLIVLDIMMPPEKALSGVETKEGMATGAVLYRLLAKKCQLAQFLVLSQLSEDEVSILFHDADIVIVSKADLEDPGGQQDLSSRIVEMLDPEGIVSRLRITMETFRSLEDGWDGYDAPCLDREIIDTAHIDILPELVGTLSVPPTVVPLTTGGIQIEYHLNGYNFEIEFTSPTRVAVLLTLEDRVLEEFDAELGVDVRVRLKEILSRIGGRNDVSI